jgi:hypothetical protein
MNDRYENCPKCYGVMRKEESDCGVVVFECVMCGNRVRLSDIEEHKAFEAENAWYWRENNGSQNVS